MSDSIYNDVIGIESEGMQTERVEMTVEIYESVRDHDFRTEINTHQPLQSSGSDCVRIRSSRAAPVCLLLLCVLLLTAVIVLCVHLQTKSTHYTEERDQLLNMITDLTEEKDQLLSKMTNQTEERDQLLNKNITLTNERDQFNQERNELWKMLNEMEGCIYQSSVYYMSSEEKSWTESRRYCRERGADLIIINNKEKEDFVKKMSGTTGVWMGLTDSDVEDRWTWVDGSTLTYT
ncbi:CD209 antigen-like protein C [Pimephales promelas]|uniref:CD209 antigen-like protein C n=1 Tax=Pimephales promelas TaxID=90988 RepID=UPI0019555F91|nr:CD209 antigen-like protein C [Pimephales promelas]